MGVDLYYDFQKNSSKGWVKVSDNFSNDRSYLLYSLLGLEGRNAWGVKAIAPLRGLPDDIELQWDEDECDTLWGEHSQSWILSDEILASARPVSVDGDEPGSVVAEFYTEVQRLHEQYGTLRIVLGFTG
ncbi:hypothetical protein OJ405_002687 [Salmonella enterica]|nr:hypothetical protein [Salmonella enterica]EKA1639185.1 hypothetical protein [Salmonella enterica]ELS1746466.1 hypothetical protein [Salmonella enterica]ELW3720629.1 hypothetical protein [Salmonella enterica]EMB7326656.1 hypothetical protein [Salmonella enterica]